jgi:hypothetical protein
MDVLRPLLSGLSGGRGLASFRAEVITELQAQPTFDIESYNTLLKSASFWKTYFPATTRRVLLVQDDGLILRPGVEDMTCKYVGAPWLKDAPYNMHLSQYLAGNLVGNGGVSLRDVGAMVRVCEGHEVDAHDLFHPGGLQPIPEDVFFSKWVQPEGVASEAEAERFAFEERAPVDGVMGFHKPWAYLPLSVVKDAFDAMLQSSCERALIEAASSVQSKS